LKEQIETMMHSKMKLVLQCYALTHPSYLS